MQELIAAFLVWIGGQTGLQIPPAPLVVLADKEQISQLMHSRPAHPSDDLRGLYHWQAGIVYLRDDWNPGELRSRATLLHELVHHVQAFNKVAYQCRAELERQAYELTAKWLVEQGVVDPYALMHTDEYTVVLISTCSDYLES